MARIDPRQGLRPTIIDRLIDPESEGTSGRSGYGIEQVLDAVRRDLEDLLNTHRTARDVPKELEEVHNSIVPFGLPDLVSYTGTDAPERARASIEQAIIRFEPRLHDVRAVLLESKEAKLTRLEFQIQATLQVEPSPEVAFVTIMKLATGETSIQPADQ
jgi:type VI secretion system protein ImpF